MEDSLSQQQSSWRPQQLGWPLSMTLGEVAEDTLLPTGLGNDPRQWSKHNVAMWLEWCTEQFSLLPTDADNFHMNGKALCLLSKADFLERAPKAGDVLFNALQLLLHRALHTARMHNGGAQSNGAVPRSTVITRDVQGFGQVLLQDPASYSQCLQVSPLPAEVDSTVILSPDPSSGGESGEQKGASPSPPSCHRSPSPASFAPRGGVSAFPGMEPKRILPRVMWDSVCVQPGSPAAPQPLALTTPAARVVADAPGDKMSVRLLWDFLQQLLNDPEQKYRHCITWKDQVKGVFKITDPHRLAKLWGMQKNHLNMNFDKMSRAMRYYYRVKILQKEPGERLCYRQFQFLRPPTELRYCKQRSLLERGRAEDEEAPGALDMSIKEECPSPCPND
ncbi:unnamed protein product [Ixodes hexagonus]